METAIMFVLNVFLSRLPILVVHKLAAAISGAFLAFIQLAHLPEVFKAEIRRYFHVHSAAPQVQPGR